jgi:hypothetical protein
MASIFGRSIGRRLALAAAAGGTGVLTANQLLSDPMDQNAIDEYNRSTTSERHRDFTTLGPEWAGKEWKISNKYPVLLSADTSAILPPAPGPNLPIPGAGLDAPWLSIDFKEEPERFCAVIKEYCWEGNVENGFKVEKNEVAGKLLIFRSQF